MFFKQRVREARKVIKKKKKSEKNADNDSFEYWMV